MGMRPVMEPWPILIGVLQVEGSSVLGSCIGRSYTCHSPTQRSTSFLEFLAPLLHFGKNRARVSDGVRDCYLQVADQ